MKESDKLHLSKAREALVKAINTSQNSSKDEESEMSITL